RAAHEAHDLRVRGHGGVRLEVVLAPAAQGQGPGGEGGDHRLGTMEREVPIRGEMIRLGQLLKLAGLIDAGGEAAAYLASHRVLVNGEDEGGGGRPLPPVARV